MKQNNYKFTLAKSYFWRTTQQQEINYVETRGQQLDGYKFKWQAKKNIKLPKTFLEQYNTTGHVITRYNFRDFVVVK